MARMFTCKPAYSRLAFLAALVFLLCAGVSAQTTVWLYTVLTFNFSENIIE